MTEPVYMAVKAEYREWKRTGRVLMLSSRRDVLLSADDPPEGMEIAPWMSAEEQEQLRAENADLRRAVPLIDDEGKHVWPSTHDNPTVLRAMLGEAHAEIEQLRSDRDGPPATATQLREAVQRNAEQQSEIEGLRQEISRLNGLITQIRQERDFEELGE